MAQLSDEFKIKFLLEYLYKMQFYLKNEITEYENGHRFSTYPADILEIYRRKCNYEFYKRISTDIEKILYMDF